MKSCALMFAAVCSIATAAPRSGKAVADWISASPSVPAGTPVQTGIRLVVDDGWHTYWSNPGEGGMQLSVKWHLPEGWSTGEVEHPAPIRFMTGDLPGFGYTGTVIFPVKLTPPADFAGEAVLKADVSWLTCNDAQCLPGNAELTLKLTAGPAKPAEEANILAAALSKVPSSLEGARLAVEESGGTLMLTITAPPASGLDLAEAKVFPATTQAIDAAAEIRFQKDGDGWKAEAPKSEYASGPLKELMLVLTGARDAGPVTLTWRAD